MAAGDGLAALVVGDGEDRETKVSLVRKLMLALKKDDEHAACDALEDFIAECKPAAAAGDDED